MARIPEIEPWQVWWADFDPQLGREQAGRRPAIIVGTELACQIPNTLALLVPCTSTDRNLPWQVPVMLGDRAGVAMCDQIKALDRRRLVNIHKCQAITDQHTRDDIAQALRELVIVTT